MFPLARKKQNMRLMARRNRQAVNEKNLFHGTTPESVEAICKQNFDWRLHGRNASKYGEGSYFAVNASYSHSYANRDDNMFQFMFLTKVLVGSYTEGHSSYRRPPPKQPSDPASDLYDSCVDNTSNPTIFVVFDTDQFYPEYIIQYSPAQLKAPTRNTAARLQPKRASSRTSLKGFSTASKPSLPAGNSSTNLAPAVFAQPRTPTRNTAARPQLKRSSSHTSLNSLSTVSKPSLPAGNSGVYIDPPMRRLGIASINTLSSRVDATLNANGSAARDGHSTVSQATSLQPPTTTMSASPTSQTYPRGILKRQPTSYSELGSSSWSSGSSVSNNMQVVSQTRPGTSLVSGPTTAQANHQGIPNKLPITSCNVQETSASSGSSTTRSPTYTNDLEEAFSRLLRDLRDDLFSSRATPSGSSGRSHSSQTAGFPKKKSDCMIM